MSCLLGFQQAYATTYYVSPSGIDTNTGTSLSLPVKTIKQALSKAWGIGDIVYVINAAMPLNAVPDDYFTVVRGNSPDIGGHEFKGLSAPRLFMAPLASDLQ